MKLIDKLCDGLGIYTEVEEEVLEQEEAPVRKKIEMPLRKNNKTFKEPETNERSFKSSIFSRGNKGEDKLITLPISEKQINVVVLEPAGFDDSQKVADYLRSNQPVVINFESCDAEVMKRMTDFISGTVYALGGSLKKIGRSILVCAPQNVDIDANTENKSKVAEKSEKSW